MRYTLLEIVQLILSAMDSDEVNSISDTVESNQVALIAKSVYYDCATDLGLIEHDTLFELNASGDAAQPVLMTLPTTVTNLSLLRYDNKLATDTFSTFEEVEIHSFDNLFLEQKTLTGTGVAEMDFVMNGETFKWKYWVDRFPTKCCVISNELVLFNGYNSSIDTTLQKSKTQAEGAVYPTFLLNDSFTPDLHPTQFSYLINRIKVRAFAELKQAQNAEASSEARRQKVIEQKRRRRTPEGAEVFKVARYGRRGPTNITNIDNKLKQGS